MSSGPGFQLPAERRRHPRHAIAEQATIVIGPTSLVFSHTLDWSVGGTRVQPPDRFAVQIGEQLSLASARLGDERVARVVGISGGSLHCAFDQDLT